MKPLDLGESHVTLLRQSFASSLIYLPDCVSLKPLRIGVTDAWDIKRRLPFHTVPLPLSFPLCFHFKSVLFAFLHSQFFLTKILFP